ncbi:MAG: PIN domain-containing protein [Bacteroidetes bacterium]|nr:PIN domain-containing protein [Bacteroidota bacterium]
MVKETLYLDTSIPSAYYDERTKERMENTRKFWEDVLPTYAVYISEITVKELENTKNERLKNKFRTLVANIKVLRTNKTIEDLATAYIEQNIFPEKYIDDARHVATASYYGITFVVSWNFVHLVKVKTRKLVNSVNILNGFKEIQIVSPLEL